jgi:hypothetical protein
MLALNSDIQQTAAGVAAAVASSYGGGDAFSAAAGELTRDSGGDMVAQAAGSLLNQLASSWIDCFNRLTGEDSDPLSDDQIARLKELQSEVISDRKLVGSAISSVNWTFGDLAADTVSQVGNLASQAVANIKDAIPAVPWVAIEVGLTVAAAVVLYALFLRVRGR